MPGEEDGGSESDNDPLFGDLAGSGLEDSGSDEEEAPQPAPAAPAPAPAGSGRAAGRAGGQASSQPQPLYSRKSVPQQRRPTRASGERSDSVALAGAPLPPALPAPPIPPCPRVLPG